METMDIEQLASYLSRDVREVGKLANRGSIPGRKVGGEWRFARAEINHWITNRLHECSPEELASLESAHADGADGPLLAELLRETTVAVPLPASTRPSVLRELVSLAEQSWVVYDPDAVLEAISTREAMSTTALSHGVALPHPLRPLPSSVLGESVVAFGRTAGGIPFGGGRGELTDLFFLVCCTDDRTHLRTLTRIMRLLRREGFLDSLRQVESSSEAYDLLLSAEREMLNA